MIDNNSSETRQVETSGCCSGCWHHLQNQASKLWNCFDRFSILIFTLKGYVPSNLYTTDFRLLFILTAIYTSLIANFRQAGNQEAQEDVVSGRLFRINPVWTNHSISGGVSDRILWNCRIDSETDSYYKSLYLGLLIFYFVVIVAYLVASMVINFLVARTVSKLNIRKDNGKVRYLDVVANEVKKVQRLRKKLKELREQWILKVNQNSLKNDIKAYKKEWEEGLNKFKINKHFHNWFTVLFIIPRIETTIMLCILTLALTSYDIHPMGCLSTIGVSYNEEESSVTLNISEDVIRYQRASAILIILLFILLAVMKLLQFLLLPRSGWGIQIEKISPGQKRCCCWPWTFSRVRGDVQDSYDVKASEENDRRFSECGDIHMWH